MAGITWANHRVSDTQNPRSDSVVEARFRNAVVPTTVDFLAESFLPEALFVFNTNRFLYNPDRNALLPIHGQLLGKEPTGTFMNSRSQGAFKLEFFLEEETRKPRSCEFTFDLSPDFEFKERPGSWSGLLKEAKRKGSVQSTWKGMEFEAYHRNEEGVTIVLRSPWPIPYGASSVLGGSDSSRFIESESYKVHSRAAWLFAQLIPGARPGYDPIGRGSGVWLIMPDRNAFRLQQGSVGDLHSAMVDDSGGPKPGQVMIEAARGLGPYAQFGVQIKHGELQWPRNLDPEHVSKTLDEQAREAERAAAALKS